MDVKETPVHRIEKWFGLRYVWMIPDEEKIVSKKNQLENHGTAQGYNLQDTIQNRKI